MPNTMIKPRVKYRIKSFSDVVHKQQFIGIKNNR